VRGLAKDKAENHWTFPLRVGSQTTFLQPDQLPMYADPAVRRVLVILHRIAKEEAVDLRWPPTESDLCRLAEIDEERNTVVFVPLRNEFVEHRFPLDLVRTAYRSENGWRVLIGR